MLAETPKPMNAAQKAWATRRAHAAARADIETLNAGIEAPSAAVNEDKPVVDIDIDDARIGCGRRRAIVLECGPRWVRLFYYQRLIVVRVDRLTFDRKAIPAKDASKKKLARIIRQNVAQAERINREAGRPVMAEGETAARLALQVLR